MAITAQMVKALREKTGAGMMDCKKALTETGGDMEKAIDFLREKGNVAGVVKLDKRLLILLHLDKVLDRFSEPGWQRCRSRI